MKNKKKTIIAISGVSGSGKDEVRKIIEKHATGTIERINFADKLKQTASLLLNVPVEKFESREYKNTYLEEWGMTVRQFLQKLGTEAVRNGLHTDAWVIAYKNDVINSEADIIITTDLRMENEFHALDGHLDDYDVHRIRIVRETTLKDWLKLDGIYDNFTMRNGFIKLMGNEKINVGDYVHRALKPALNLNMWKTEDDKKRVEQIYNKRTHFSETGLDNYAYKAFEDRKPEDRYKILFDFVFENESTIENLENKIKSYFQQCDFWLDDAKRYSKEQNEKEIYIFMAEVHSNICPYYMDKYKEFFLDNNGEFYNECLKYYPADPFKTAKAIEKFLA